MNRGSEREQPRQTADNNIELDPDGLWTAGLIEFLTEHRPEIYAPLSAAAYKTEFKKWMEAWMPHAFVTINLPHEGHRRRVSRDAQFYLNLWTRRAEAAVLGPRTLKRADYAHRIVWILRREEAPDGLIHYHGIVKFPPGRAWKGETGLAHSDSERCQRLQEVLREVSRRTPEPYANSLLDRALGADIDVRPIDVERHAPYLLKGLWNNVPEEAPDETTYDSGLIILPHLPKRGTLNGNRTANTEPLDRVSRDATRTHLAAPSGSRR
jgi:hypothetical protein